MAEGAALRRRPGLVSGSGRSVLDGDQGGLGASLARFDLFPKVEATVARQTQSGGAVTVICALLVTLLVVSELRVFLRHDFAERIAVDTLLRERLQINVNITYHALACSQVDLVAMDVTGEQQLELQASTRKTPIKKSAGGAAADEGKCLTCFGAGEDGQCCNTCAELAEAYGEKGWDVKVVLKTAEQCKDEVAQGLSPEEMMERAQDVVVDHGCNLAGTLQVNKVAGNFHVALGHGRSMHGRLSHQFNPSQITFFNTSHTIHELWFGSARLPGAEAGPLEQTSQIVDPHKARTGAFQYHLEIVPTQYKKRRYYQYTKTEQFTPLGAGDEARAEMHKGHGHAQPAVISSLPGTFFVYDLSPFAIIRTDRHEGLGHFLTNLLAIVGGTFALSRFVDSVLSSVLPQRSSA